MSVAGAEIRMNRHQCPSYSGSDSSSGSVLGSRYLYQSWQVPLVLFLGQTTMAGLDQNAGEYEYRNLWKVRPVVHQGYSDADVVNEETDSDSRRHASGSLD